MLHNHLRNFTSHELAVHFHASDESHDRADSVYQFCHRVEIGCYHTCRFRDACHAVALCEGGACSHKKGREEENLFRHNKLFFVPEGWIGPPTG